MDESLKITDEMIDKTVSEGKSISGIGVMEAYQMGHLFLSLAAVVKTLKEVSEKLG